jgi:hypothetical protein
VTARSRRSEWLLYVMIMSTTSVMLPALFNVLSTL